MSITSAINIHDVNIAPMDAKNPFIGALDTEASATRMADAYFSPL